MLIVFSDKLAITLCSLVVGLPGDQFRSPVWKVFFPHVRVDDEKKDEENAQVENKDNTQEQNEENAQASEDQGDDKPWHMFDKSLALLSAVNGRILERPQLREIGLYRYLHAILVFMRYLTTRLELLERFSNEFHTELMVPILNRLLRKYQAEGGDNWNRILRDGFPQKYTGGLPADCLMYRTRVGVPRYSHPLPDDWALRGCAWAPEAPPIPEEPLELSEKQIARSATLAQWEDDAYAVQEKKDAKAKKKAHKIGRWDRRKVNHTKGLREHLRKNANALNYRIGHLPVAWFTEDDPPDSVNAAKDDPTDSTKDTTEDATENTTENATKDSPKDTPKVTFKDPPKVTFKDPHKATFKNVTTDKHSRRQARKARKNAPKDIPVPEEVPKDEPKVDVPEKVEFPDFFLAEWYQKHEAEAEEYRQNLAKAKAEEQEVKEEKKKVDPNSLEIVVAVPADWFEKPDHTYFPSSWFQNCGHDIDERCSQESHIESLDIVQDRDVRLLWLARDLMERDAFFHKEYEDNGKRWHFVARGRKAVLKPNFFDGDDLPAETETDRGKGVFVYLDDIAKVLEPAKVKKQADSKEAPSAPQLAPQTAETSDEPQPALAPRTTDVDDEPLSAVELAIQKAETAKDKPPTTDVEQPETGDEMSTTDGEQPNTDEAQSAVEEQSLAIVEPPSADEKALPKAEDAVEAADEGESDDNNEDTEDSTEDGEGVDTQNGSVIGDNEKHDEEGEEIEAVEDGRGEREEENVVGEQEHVVEQDEKADNVSGGARPAGSYATVVDKAAAKAAPAGEPAKLTSEALKQVETEKPYDTNQYKYLQTVPTEGTVATQDEEDEDWEHMSDEDAENDANTNRILQVLRF